MKSFISSVRRHLVRGSVTVGTLQVLMMCAAGMVQAASFDCSKARAGVEQVVCLDPALSKQDVDMAKLYRDALVRSVDPVAVRQSQRDWLRLVRNQCGTVACLSTAYGARISALAHGTPFKLDDSLSGLSGVNTHSSGTVYFGAPDSNHQGYANWLKETKVLEGALQLVRARAPQTVLPNVFAFQCNPDRGAFYLSKDNLVVVCYQLVRDLADYYLPRSKQPDSSAEDEGARMLASLQFAVLHEVGHGLLHRQRAAGSLGNEEVEADNFASAILLASRATTRQVQDAILGVWGLTTTFGMKEQNGWAEYGDEHALPQQRFATFACLALGKEPAIGPWLATTSILPQRRMSRCPAEWERTSNGLRSLLLAVR